MVCASRQHRVRPKPRRDDRGIRNREVPALGQQRQVLVDRFLDRLFDRERRLRPCHLHAADLPGGNQHTHARFHTGTPHPRRAEARAVLPSRPKAYARMETALDGGARARRHVEWRVRGAAQSCAPRRAIAVRTTPLVDLEPTPEDTLRGAESTTAANTDSPSPVSEPVDCHTVGEANVDASWNRPAPSFSRTRTTVRDSRAVTTTSRSRS